MFGSLTMSRTRSYPAKLQAEQSGILAWAVRGCLEWQRLHSLGVPTEVRVARASYRQDMDTIAAFSTSAV
jgi:putative DNA primase/helicase